MIINTNIATPYCYLQIMQDIICLNIEETEQILEIKIRLAPAG